MNRNAATHFYANQQSVSHPVQTFPSATSTNNLRNFPPKVITRVNPVPSNLIPSHFVQHVPSRTLPQVQYTNQPSFQSNSIPGSVIVSNPFDASLSSHNERPQQNCSSSMTTVMLHSSAKLQYDKMHAFSNAPVRCCNPENAHVHQAFPPKNECVNRNLPSSHNALERFPNVINTNPAPAAHFLHNVPRQYTVSNNSVPNSLINTPVCTTVARNNTPRATPTVCSMYPNMQNTFTVRTTLPPAAHTVNLNNNSFNQNVGGSYSTFSNFPPPASSNMMPPNLNMNKNTVTANFNASENMQSNFNVNNHVRLQHVNSNSVQAQKYNNMHPLPLNHMHPSTLNCNTPPSNLEPNNNSVQALNFSINNKNTSLPNVNNNVPQQHNFNLNANNVTMANLQNCNVPSPNINFISNYNQHPNSNISASQSMQPTVPLNAYGTKQVENTSTSSLPANYVPQPVPVAPPHLPFPVIQPQHFQPYPTSAFIPSSTYSENSSLFIDPKMKAINEFLANLNEKKLDVEKRKESSMPVQVFRYMMKEAFEMVEMLQESKQYLISSINDEDELWNEKMKKMAEYQAKLSTVCQKILVPKVVNGMQRRLKKIKKKRKQKKLQRERYNSLKREKEKSRAELHRKIDLWLDTEKEKNMQLKRETEMKKEADNILLEVRRKIHEAKRTLEKLNVFEKLRHSRKENVIKKGMVIYPEFDSSFEQKIQKLKELMLKQLIDYEDEEKALKVMLETEQEGQREEEIKFRLQKMKKWQEIKQKDILRGLFGNLEPPSPADPLFLFWQYYNSGNTSIDNLVKIRHVWDTYLVPLDHPEGSTIPQQWVTPELPSNKAWELPLKKKN